MTEPKTAAKIRVWDPFVRLFHWSLVASFFIAYLSGDDDNPIHIYAGYAVMGLVAARTVWGFVGTKYARFSQFAYPLSSMIKYLKELSLGHPAHYTGHNPAAAWMIYTLLVFLVLTTVSGLKVYGVEGHGPLAGLPETGQVIAAGFGPVSDAHAKDDFRRSMKKRGRKHENELEEIWEEIHEFFSNVTLMLVFVHVAGAIVASKIHKENLVKAMITGVKEKGAGKPAD